MKSMPANSDLIVAIIEVIAANTISTENHLISPEDLFGLNPKQLEKPWEIEEMGLLPFLSRQTRRRGRRRGALGVAAAAAVSRSRRWRLAGRKGRPSYFDFSCFLCLLLLLPMAVALGFSIPV
jgi:hypothetical protein